MMIFSKKQNKHIKQQKLIVKMYNYKKKTTNLFLGSYGLKAMEFGRLTPKQIEATRRVFSKTLKKNIGHIYIRIFPHISITKKPKEMRMGKGKGIVKTYVALIKTGTILFELSGISYKIAKTLLMIAATKLPFKTKFIYFKNII